MQLRGRRYHLFVPLLILSALAAMFPFALAANELEDFEKAMEDLKAYWSDERSVDSFKKTGNDSFDMRIMRLGNAARKVQGQVSAKLPGVNLPSSVNKLKDLVDTYAKRSRKKESKEDFDAAFELICKRIEQELALVRKSGVYGVTSAPPQDTLRKVEVAELRQKPEAVPVPAPQNASTPVGVPQAPAAPVPPVLATSKHELDVLTDSQEAETVAAVESAKGADMAKPPVETVKVPEAEALPAPVPNAPQAQPEAKEPDNFSRAPIDELDELSLCFNRLLKILNNGLKGKKGAMGFNKESVEKDFARMAYLSSKVQEKCVKAGGKEINLRKPLQLFQDSFKGMAGRRVGEGSRITNKSFEQVESAISGMRVELEKVKRLKVYKSTPSISSFTPPGSEDEGE